MERYVTKSDFNKIMPLDSVKKSYGTVKAHKPGMPLRPICSSINSVSSGAEKYILKILKPIEKLFEFTINSTKNFQKYFLENRHKFDPSVHEIISIDCVSLYTSVNVNMVIKELITEIYKSPEKYFEFGEDDLSNFGVKPRIPTSLVFKNFLFQILLKFNYFSTVAGHYKQKDGLSMGSSISPLLANFYVSLMEKKIVKKEINKGNIIAYCRYVDDGFCIIRKDKKRKNTKIN